MSVRMMTLVWYSKMEQPNQRFVLLCYADHSDDQGKNIFPSVARIHAKTGYSERQIQRITRALQNGQYLLDDGAGPRGENKWKLNIPKLREMQNEDWSWGDILTPPENEGVTSATKGGDKSCRKGVTPMSPESSSESSLNHHSTKRAPRETPNPKEWWGIPDLKRWKHPFDYVLYLWGEYFPEKNQPAATDNKRRARVAKRWQDRNFWSNICRALEISSTNSALQSEDWFDFDYVIRNPDTMQKMLADWMRWKHDKNQESNKVDDVDFVDVTAQRINASRNGNGSVRIINADDY